MGTVKRGMVSVGVLLAGAVLAGAYASEESVAGNESALRKQALSLNDVTGADPMDGALKKISGDSKAAKKLLAVAAKMTKESPQPFNRNATLLLGVIAENAREVDTSATFYRLHAKQSLALLSERGLTQAYGRLIDLYLKNKRYTEGEKACKEFLALEGEEGEAVDRLKPMVMRQLVLVIAKQGATDRALKMVEEMIKADPRNWLYRALKAQVLHEAEQNDEAAKVYLDVIDRVERDGRLEKEDKQDFLDDYRYALSNLYIETGNVEKAAEQLKTLLAHKPNNPTYNNDLGYIWADKGLHLAEAEKLIRKAIEEERKIRQKENVKEDNAAYLDSLGWVLFKQGKAKEAKPHLVQAVKSSEGQSIEIYDHLAEVHLALGEKGEAIAVMKKGLEVAGTSKREVKRKAEVEKKLKMYEGK